jgi:hypothetical protein
VLEGEPGWLAELARRTGVPLGLRGEPRLPISGHHVES